MNIPGEVSVTVVTHNVFWPADTEAGKHDTLVDVFRGVTVTVKAVVVALPE